MKLFGFTFRNTATVTYSVVERGGYYVVKRTYTNGNVKTDRLGSRRADSTVRTAVNGRAFG